MSNRKTPNFAYGNFPTERDLICVKEFAYGSPKLSPTEITSPNPNIKSNSDGGFPVGFN